MDSTIKEFLTVQKEENRKVERKVKYYNLDMIISLGYRIKSKVVTNFRRWATERLKHSIAVARKMVEIAKWQTTYTKKHNKK